MSAFAALAPYVPPGIDLSRPALLPYAAPSVPTLVLSAPIGRVGPFVPAAARTPVAPTRFTAVAATSRVVTPIFSGRLITTPVLASPIVDASLVESTLVAAADATEPEVEVSFEAANAATMTSPATLPWIDAFLRSTPTAPIIAVPAPSDDAGSEALETSPASHLSADEAFVAELGENVADAPAAVCFEDEATGLVALRGLADWVDQADRAEHESNDAAARADNAEWSPDIEYAAEELHVAEQPFAAEQAFVAEESLVAENMLAVPTSVEAPDEWPLDEAAEEFRNLSAQLESATSRTPAETVASRSATPGHVASLAPWHDDDLIDIMPMPSSPTLSALAQPPADGTLWSDRARRGEATFSSPAAVSAADAPGLDSSAAEQANEAAVALELLAQRMRAGELAVPNYDPRLGEQAVLVAALAAVLGLRPR